jgi:hypothetical protein
VLADLASRNSCHAGRRVWDGSSCGRWRSSPSSSSAAAPPMRTSVADRTRREDGAEKETKRVGRATSCWRRRSASGTRSSGAPSRSSDARMPCRPPPMSSFSPPPPAPSTSASRTAIVCSQSAGNVRRVTQSRAPSLDTSRSLRWPAGPHCRRDHPHAHTGVGAQTAPAGEDDAHRRTRTTRTRPPIRLLCPPSLPKTSRTTTRNSSWVGEREVGRRKATHPGR